MELLVKMILSCGLAGLTILAYMILMKKRKEVEKEKHFENFAINVNDDIILENTLDKCLKDTLTLENNSFKYKEYKPLYLRSDYKESLLRKQYEEINLIIDDIKNIKVDFENRLERVSKEVNPGLYDDSIIHEKALVVFKRRREIYLKYLYNRRSKIYSLYNNVKNGRLGEEFVWNTISKFDNCLCLKDKRLEYTENGKTYSIQMDSIIISSKGLFICEVKNMASEGQYDIEIDKIGTWRAKYPNGKEFIINDNANKQNNKHIIYLNKIINKELGTKDERYIEAKGITVIGNNKAKVNNLSENQTVLCADEIYNYINKFEFVYNDEQKKYLYDFIEEHHKTSPKNHPVTNWIEEARNVSKVVKEDLERLSLIILDKENSNRNFLYKIETSI